MITGSLLFLAGVGVLMPLSSLPPFWLVFLLPVLPLAALRWRWLRWLAWFSSGFLWALLIAHLKLAPGLDPGLQGVPLRVTGHVASLPEVGEHYVRFDLRVSAMDSTAGETLPVPGMVRLNWYRPYPELVPGMRLHLTVKLKRPHGYMNPGGFDYEGWLFQRSIRARGYVMENNAGPDAPADSVFTIHRLRFALQQRLTSIGDAFYNESLIRALALGDRSTVSRQQWRVLSHTGTNHLLAISGLHIGLVGGIVFLLVRRAWPLLSVRAALRVPAPRAAAAVALLAAGGYAMLAGFTIPTQRALIMLGVLLLTRMLSRQPDRRTSFGLALLTVLILDPFAVLAPGFWLSFAAVAIILLALADPLLPAVNWYRFARVQWYVFLGLAPLLAFWFARVPVLSILANSVAIPWISLVTVPTVLLGTLLLPLQASLGGVVLGLADLSLSVIWSFLERLAGIETGVLSLPQASPAVLAAGMAGTVLLLAPRATPGKWLGSLWLLPLLFPASESPGEGEFRFTLLDVGQGLAAVIRTREHTLTYDTGPSYGSGFNTGWAVVVPYLRQRGVDRVDVHIQSHTDNDHVGGLADLLASIPVDRILTSRPVELPQTPSAACRGGQSWVWDGIQFRILHPPAGPAPRGNDGSCVLRVSRGGHSILLTGDIERRSERVLLEAYGDRLQSTVLVVPHHGSASSSGSRFVQAVAAEYALFTAGYLNRYRLPNQAIIDRYRDSGAVLFATSSCGAIQFQFTGNGIEIQCPRREAPRFWHNRP